MRVKRWLRGVLLTLDKHLLHPVPDVQGTEEAEGEGGRGWRRRNCKAA